MAAKLQGSTLQASIISPETSISEAVKHMNSEVALVCDSKTRLIGMLTDGDIRRAFLKGAAYIAKTLSVPADTTVELAGTSKIVLEAGDKIQGLASAASDVEVFLSWLHIT